MIGFVVSPTPDSRSPATSTAPGTAFGLFWSIKRSFVAYIKGMPDGQIALSEGARLGDDLGIVFPPLQSAHRLSQEGSTERVWDFGGSVYFRGHFGLLSVHIAFPSLHLYDDVGGLTIAHPNGTGDRLTLADITLAAQPAPPGTHRWDSTQVRLNDQAIGLFGNSYAANQPLDQFTLLLPDI
jgi:hypothetical protein